MGVRGGVVRPSFLGGGEFKFAGVEEIGFQPVESSGFDFVGVLALFDAVPACFSAHGDVELVMML